MITPEKTRQILNDHRSRIEQLANQLAASRQENQDLRAQLNDLNYALRRLQTDAQRPHQQPQKTALPSKILNIGDTQILILLYNIGAVGRTSPASVTTIKQAFRLADSEKTIRRRLNALEHQGVVEHIGAKPKLFFLNENGLVTLNKERKSTLKTAPQQLDFASHEIHNYDQF